MEYRNTYIVIPAKNESKYIQSLISQIRDIGFSRIVVVNDQSSDETASIAERFPSVSVLDHVINLGPGAATQTGIAYAVSKGAEIILTIDADLQHNPNDLLRLRRHLLESNSDLVIGSRFLQKNDIPLTRIFYNKVGNFISYLLTGKFLTDSQSGLKAISGSLASQLDLKYDGFEFCMEIIKQAKNSESKISEIPVEVKYTKETLSKGQNFMSGLNMISRILSPFN